MGRTELNWNGNELNRNHPLPTELNLAAPNWIPSAVGCGLVKSAPFPSQAVLSPLRWRPWAPNPNYDLLPSSHFTAAPKPLKDTKRYKTKEEEVSKGDRGGRGMSRNLWNPIGISRFRRRPRFGASTVPSPPPYTKIPGCVKSAPQNPT